jgi:3-oxoacyl-[acyl-carrier protein] reductase
MDLGLKGKKALVTGATRGIGRAIVELLADEGCDVALCARSAEPAAQTAAALAKKGVKAIGSAVDVTNLATLKGWVAESAGKLGGVDIYIANVSALAQGMDEDSWRRGFETDVMATVFGCEAAVPFLEKSTGGAIVVVGSTAMAEINGPNRAYAAVKAAIVPYVKGLARNLAAKNVRANLVSPGNVYFKDGVWGSVERNNPEVFKMMLARNPTGRMGTPQEVANAVVFLASPRASFITGSNLIIDGALPQRVQF